MNSENKYTEKESLNILSAAFSNSELQNNVEFLEQIQKCAQAIISNDKRKKDNEFNELKIYINNYMISNPENIPNSLIELYKLTDSICKYDKPRWRYINAWNLF